MSETEQNEIEAAREQYGRLVVVEIDGVTLGFKPASRDAISVIRTKLEKESKQALHLLKNFCGVHCVVGRKEFDGIADKYPLLVVNGDPEDGGDATSIAGAIFDMAKGRATITVS